ncbi:unnamed protein product [Prunus armeniaca]
MSVGRIPIGQKPLSIFFSTANSILKNQRESRWRFTLMEKTSCVKTLEPQRTPYPCTLDRKITSNRIKWEGATKREKKVR